MTEPHAIPMDATGTHLNSGSYNLIPNESLDKLIKVMIDFVGARIKGKVVVMYCKQVALASWVVLDPSQMTCEGLKNCPQLVP